MPLYPGTVSFSKARRAGIAVHQSLFSSLDLGKLSGHSPVTLSPDPAGQDMVPEQTLQVQEADEARRGSSGGQRAGEWQGLVCRLPTGTTRLESELLFWEGLWQQRWLLRPQLHIVVSLSTPRSYAAASTDVRLSVRTHPLPDRLPWPGPSRLQVHPPFRMPCSRRRRAQGRGREEGKNKRKRNSEGRGLSASSKPLKVRPSDFSALGPNLVWATVTAEWLQSAGTATGDSQCNKTTRWTRPDSQLCETIRKKKYVGGGYMLFFFRFCPSFVSFLHCLCTEVKVLVCLLSSFYGLSKKSPGLSHTCLPAAHHQILERFFLNGLLPGPA